MNCITLANFRTDIYPFIGAGGGDFGGIDFSKLGGGAAPMGEEEDDDDMPALEGEEAAADKGKTPAAA